MQPVATLTATVKSNNNLLKTTAQTLVVFDSRVPDLEFLYGALAAGLIARTISPDVDALNAITELLARTGARSLAIVAHGEPGVLPHLYPKAQATWGHSSPISSTTPPPMVWAN